MADQKINTGNAVPSADPRDRHDNSIGLDEAVTSKQPYWIDRLGVQRRTLHWMETAATGIPAIEAAERAEAAAAAAQMSAGIFDDTTKGLAGTTSGKYFTVPQPGSVDAMLLYKNNAGVAQFITAYSTGLANSLTVNYGKIYPFRNAPRTGASNTPNDLMLQSILAIKVMNAKPGMYYALRYFQNQSPAVVAAADNWIIEEAPIAGYSTSAITPETSIATLQDNPQPLVNRSLGIQTLTLSTKTDVKILVTLDASKLPPAGTPVAMNSVNVFGYGHVIDPACYEGVIQVGAVDYSIDKDGKIRVNWLDADGSGKSRGFEFGNVGANNLPNVSGLRLGNKLFSSWATDWLPPLIIDALNNTDSAGLNFTGGNHLVGGKQTAINVRYEVFADGVRVGPGSAGKADVLMVRLANRVMAGNTVVEGRYVATQDFKVEFTSGGASVECEVTPLEALDLYIDYGPQMVTGGAGGTLFYFDGKHANPIPFDGNETSGKPSEFPDAWASCYVYGDGSGQLSAWIDRSYGIADAKNSSDSYGLIIGGGPASTKQYPTAVHRFLQRNTESPNGIRLTARQSYKWRGGWTWEPVDLRPGISVCMNYRNDGRPRRAEAVIGGSKAFGVDRSTTGAEIKAVNKKLDSMGKFGSEIPNGGFESSGFGNSYYGDRVRTSTLCSPVNPITEGVLNGLGCMYGFELSKADERTTGNYIEIDGSKYQGTESLGMFASVLVYSPDGVFDFDSAGNTGALIFRDTVSGGIQSTKMRDFVQISQNVRRYTGFLAASGDKIATYRVGVTTTVPRARTVYVTGVWLSLIPSSALPVGGVQVSDTLWPSFATGAVAPVNAMASDMTQAAIIKRLDAIGAAAGSGLSIIAKALRNPLTSLVVTLIGDSITWGMTAQGHAPTEPRAHRLDDARNNLTSKSWANLLRQFFGYTYSYGDVVEDAPGSGYYEREHSVDFTNGDKRFTFVNKNSLKEVTPVIDARVGPMFGRYADIGRNQQAIEFDLTSDNLTVVFSGAGANDPANDRGGIVDVETGEVVGSFLYGGTNAWSAKAAMTFPYKKRRVRLVDLSTGQRLRVEALIVKHRIKVVNNGISGTWTGEWVPGLHLLTGGVPVETDVVIAQLGTNDRIQGTVAPVNPHRTKDNMRKIVTELRDVRGKSVVLMCANATLDNIDYPGGDPTKYFYSMQDVNRVTGDLAKEMGLDFIDNYTPSKIAMARGENLLADGLHPNDAGHYLIFTTIEKALAAKA